MSTTPRRKLPFDAFTECYYVPGETSIVDLIHPDDGLTLYFEKDEAAVLAEYAAAKRMTFAAASEAIETAALARYRKDISEITEERFIDALNILPPVGWTTSAGVESFRMSERLWGDITDIFARLGTRYFMLSDDIRIKAHVIAARVADYAERYPSPSLPAPQSGTANASAPTPAPTPGEAT